MICSDDDDEYLHSIRNSPRRKQIRCESSEDDFSDDEEYDSEGNVDEVKLVEQMFDGADETYLRR